MILNFGKNDPIFFEYDKIQVQSDSKIVTKKAIKAYKPVCYKGIIDEDLNVLPFGYVPNK